MLKAPPANTPQTTARPLPGSWPVNGGDDDDTFAIALNRLAASLNPASMRSRPRPPSASVPRDLTEASRFSRGGESDSRLAFGGSALDCDALRDDQWERLKEYVPGGRKGKRGPRTDNRRFLNALLWMARSGARWRDLPEGLGDYATVKRRYYRWIEMGVLDAILAALAREADLEWLMIDSTIVRAHQHAAGARRQKGGRMPRALAAPAEA